MQHVLSLTLATIAVLATAAPVGATTTTGTTTIRAIVSGAGTCSIGSVGNPSIASTPIAVYNFDLVTDATLTVTCTDADTPYRIYAPMSNNANDAVQRRVKSTTAAAYLNYDIYTDAARTTRWPTDFPTGVGATGLSTVYHTYPRVPSQSGAANGVWVDTISFVVTY